MPGRMNSRKWSWRPKPTARHNRPRPVPLTPAGATFTRRRNVVAGGVLELAEATAADGSAALMIVLPVALDDARLPAAFVALITEAQAAA